MVKNFYHIYMFLNFKKNSTKVDGAVINYVIKGSGPPLLLLHGYPRDLGGKATTQEVTAAIMEQIKKY